MTALWKGKRSQRFLFCSATIKLNKQTCTHKEKTKCGSKRDVTILINWTKEWKMCDKYVYMKLVPTIWRCHAKGSSRKNNVEGEMKKKKIEKWEIWNVHQLSCLLISSKISTVIWSKICPLQHVTCALLQSFFVLWGATLSSVFFVWLLREGAGERLA